MPQIPITFSPSSSSSSSSTHPSKLPHCLAKISHDQIVLIELQGSLQVEGGDGDDDPDASSIRKNVGTLKIDDEEVKPPTLIIGHHLLEGKIQTLSKPLAVIKRSANSDEGLEGSGASWTIVAIVKKKIVFAKRPMPITKKK